MIKRKKEFKFSKPQERIQIFQNRSKASSYEKQKTELNKNNK